MTAMMMKPMRLLEITIREDHTAAVNTQFVKVERERRSLPIGKVESLQEHLMKWSPQLTWPPALPL